MMSNFNCHLQLPHLVLRKILHMSLTGVGFPIIKIRRSHDCLIFIIEIPIPRNMFFYIEMGLWSYLNDIVHTQLSLYQISFWLKQNSRKYKQMCVDMMWNSEF